MKISIIGSGSWGTAVAVHLAGKGINVTLCSMTEEKYKTLVVNRENVVALPGVKIPDNVHISHSIEESVTDADVLILAVASTYTRQTAEKIKSYVKEGAYILELGKGIEEDSLKLLFEVVKEVIPQARVGVLSGPSHAEELGNHIPTTCVVSAFRREDAVFLRDILASEVFRVYINSDIYGVSLGGALKNVIALAAGIADGIGYGDNTKAALITRGNAEICRLGKAMGCSNTTFAGLSGIGDLVVTCASMHSRNRRAGILIGQGRSADDAMKEVKMVVEGVYAAKAAKKLADKYNTTMPIVNEVNNILFCNKDPKSAVNDLMIRDNIVEAEVISWREEN